MRASVASVMTKTTTEHLFLFSRSRIPSESLSDARLVVIAGSSRSSLALLDQWTSPGGYATTTLATTSKALTCCTGWVSVSRTSR